jgi:hypothetical protein
MMIHAQRYFKGRHKLFHRAAEFRALVKMVVSFQVPKIWGISVPERAVPMVVIYVVRDVAYRVFERKVRSFGN